MTHGKMLFYLTFALCASVSLPALAASDLISVPTPMAGTRIDSVVVSVNGEPITLLDVILETGSRERELAGIFSGQRLSNETLELLKAMPELIDEQDALLGSGPFVRGTGSADVEEA